jgi:hypothetical protein
MNEETYVEIMVRLKKVFHNTKKQENIDVLAAMAKEAGMDDVEFVMTASQRLTQINNNNNNNSPTPTIPTIVTIPGTLGEIFDKWKEAGWDCSNVNDPKYPDGQQRALEAINGYNWRYRPSPKPVLRDQTTAWLNQPGNEGRADYFDMLQNKFNKWQRNK